MDKKISILIKSLTDKASLTKMFNGIQSFFNKKNLRLTPNIDTSEIQKQFQATISKVKKQFTQKQNKISGEIPSSQTVESASAKSNSRQITTSTSPPKTTSTDKNGIGERTMFQW